MTSDPFDALRLPVEPVDPEPRFVADLHDRLRALHRGATDPTRTLGGTMSTTTTTPTSRAHIPPAHHSINAYLMVDDARRALDWYRAVFDATVEGEPIIMDDGRVGHAEIRIGDSLVMLADEFPEMGLVGPNARGGTSVSLSAYVPDVDATYAKAIDAGARSVGEVENQFHGSRRGTVIDPFGHRWMISTWLGGGAGSADEPSESTGGSTQAADLWNEVGYYVLRVPDIDKGRAFWGGLFGWHFSEEAVSPWGERNSHVDNSIVPFGLSENAQDSPFVTPYFRVADLAAAVETVRRLGGQVLESTDYETGGDAVCVDDQGVRFNLWQPAPGY
ncbi:MAG TPA: VOC family protein [Microthrixaceae bacterium]|nr:VOC family protein [Microthrixaceae bacterium]